jgi:hypothetical protein
LVNFYNKQYVRNKNHRYIASQALKEKVTDLIWATNDDDDDDDDYNRTHCHLSMNSIMSSEP